MKIACLGEVMIELSPLSPDTAQIGVAGDTYNTAVYLKRLLPDLPVSYVTGLGDEAMSARILSALTAEGIDTDLIETRTGMSPGLYMITRDAAGERSFSYWRSAAAARTVFADPCSVTPDALDGFDIVYLSGISLAILPQATRDRLYAWIDGFRARGGRVAFDSNYRPRLWENVETARAQTMEMWRRADVALPSVDDEQELFAETTDEAVLTRLRSAGATFGALKRGALGPVSLADGATFDVTPVTRVVDTTAAGDSFAAGFLAALSQGRDILDCMKTGHAVSATVICHPGAILPRDVALPGV